MNLGTKYFLLSVNALNHTFPIILHLKGKHWKFRAPT